MDSPSNDSASTPPPAFYLPDFCATPTVLAVVLISELVAIVLTLARQELVHGFWIDLARTSLFLLWIGLTSATALCYTRPYLARLGVATASAISLALPLAVTLLISEVTYLLGKTWFEGLEPGVSSLFPADHTSFLLRNFVIAFIVAALTLRYFFVAHEWRRNVEMKARLRIDALQARIRPHFLFNSMNTIAALTRSNPRQAEEAVEDLADLFRASLEETRGRIPLKEELEVARIYQRIEQLRLGNRLKVSWQTDALPMRTLVPSLLVQPLLENAIYHGIEPLPEGGTVVVSGERKDDVIELRVSNPVHALASGTPHLGNRIALDNIRERLELAYPGRASVNVVTSATEYVVTLTFPLVEPAADASA